MNILFFPNHTDRRADGDAETAIRSMGGTPVALGDPASGTVDGVVLVLGAESLAFFAAGVCHARRIPTCLYVSAGAAPLTGRLAIKVAGGPLALRTWLGNVFMRGVRIAPDPVEEDASHDA